MLMLISMPYEDDGILLVIIMEMMMMCSCVHVFFLCATMVE